MQPVTTTADVSAALPIFVDTLDTLKGIIKPLKAAKKFKPSKQKIAKEKKPPQAKPLKVYKVYDDGRLLAGETGYCAWCRSTFLCARNYSKPQYFCQPSCNRDWQNQRIMLALAESSKAQNAKIPNGQRKALQIEAERKAHGISGLKASDLVRMKPKEGSEKIMGCEKRVG